MKCHAKFATVFLLLAISLALLSDVSAKGPPVRVTEAIPSEVEQGQQNVHVKIKGKGFASGSTVEFLETGTEIPAVFQVPVIEYDSDTGDLNTIIHVGIEAKVTGYDIRVTTSGRGGKGTDLFRVNQKSNGESDTTPPGAITNLRTQWHDSTSVRMAWTAPGDDGLYEGTVDHYDMRVARQGAVCPSDPQQFDWSPAYPIYFTYGGQDDPLKPLCSAQCGQSQQIDHLEPLTCYAIESEAVDEAGNRSGKFYTTGTTEAPITGWTVPELVSREDSWHKGHTYDEDNEPVFLFGQSGGGYTRFAKRSSSTGIWVEENVIRTRGEGSLDLVYNDVTGNLMAVAADHKRDLKFLESINGSWQSTLVYRKPTQWSYHALTYDAGGMPLITFRANDLVWIARLNGNSFSTELVASVRGLRPAVAIHPLTNLPAIVYAQSDSIASATLMHFVEYDGTVWNDVVFAQDGGGAQPMFVYDPNGNPVVFYHGNSEVRPTIVAKLVRRHPDTGVWNIIEIDPAGTGNQRATSMLYRSDGTLFLTWADNDDIKVGRLCESGRGFACESLWNDLDVIIFEVANEMGNAVSDTTKASIALDPTGPDGGTPSFGIGTDDGLFFQRCIPGASLICTPDAEASTP